MILIRFPDAASERRARGYLAGRFSFKSWASGETLVPEAALPALAVEGIRFSAEGSVTSEQLVPPLRDPAPRVVQLCKVVLALPRAGAVSRDLAGGGIR